MNTIKKYHRGGNSHRNQKGRDASYESKYRSVRKTTHSRTTNPTGDSAANNTIKPIKRSIYVESSDNTMRGLKSFSSSFGLLKSKGAGDSKRIIPLKKYFSVYAFAYFFMI